MISLLSERPVIRMPSWTVRQELPGIPDAFVTRAGVVPAEHVDVIQGEGEPWDVTFRGYRHDVDVSSFPLPDLSKVRGEPVFSPGPDGPRVRSISILTDVAVVGYDEEVEETTFDGATVRYVTHVPAVALEPRTVSWTLHLPQWRRSEFRLDAHESELPEYSALRADMRGGLRTRLVQTSVTDSPDWLVTELSHRLDEQGLRQAVWQILRDVAAHVATRDVMDA